jgi:hypothetical protein
MPVHGTLECLVPVGRRIRWERWNVLARTAFAITGAIVDFRQAGFAPRPNEGIERGGWMRPRLVFLFFSCPCRFIVTTQAAVDYDSS